MPPVGLKPETPQSQVELTYLAGLAMTFLVRLPISVCTCSFLNLRSGLIWVIAVCQRDFLHISADDIADDLM